MFFFFYIIINEHSYNNIFLNLLSTLHNKTILVFIKNLILYW